MAIFYEDRVNELHLWGRETLDFLPHFHDSFEIVYILSGKTRAIIDGNEYILEGGDICISMPNVIHSYDGEENIKARLMIVPRLYAEPYLSILKTSTVKTPIIKACEDTEEIFELIKTAFETNKSKHPFKKQKMCGYFSVIFGEIFAKAELIECKKSPQETERRIISYCLENFRRDISLELLSKELNISKNHISSIFSSKLKISMPDFIGSLRTGEAKRLIESGKSMTDAAFEAGFASIRTFNRRFLSEVGKTPSEYALEFSNEKQ